MKFILKSEGRTEELASFEFGEVKIEQVDAEAGILVLHTAGSNTTAYLDIQGKGDVQYRLQLELDDEDVRVIRRVISQHSRV
ncbi:MAG: hypothetical protein KDK08_06560 [Rhizobiaceae bacterium]|nr:hypothetical protein [Caldilineaceae bacterium]MCB1466793.1 hypothetical protein [Rhizobiaceae bacterium]